MTTPIEIAMNAVDWKPIDGAGSLLGGDLPYATHEGKFRIVDFEFRCYQLSDGRRILDADDVSEFFGGFDGVPEAQAIFDKKIKFRKD